MAKKIVFTEEMDFWLRAGWGTQAPADIAGCLGVSMPTIYRRAKEIGLKTQKEPRNKIRLSDDQLDYLVKKYKNTDNGYLAMELDISESTLHRYARRYGLKKTPAYMRQCQAEAAAASGYFARLTGRRPPKGRPFKKGEDNRPRLSYVAERMRREKLKATRRKVVAEERRRISLGLPQKTKLHLSTLPSQKVTAQRFYLRKRGYTVEGLTAYYGPDTARSKYVETKYIYFTFKSL